MSEPEAKRMSDDEIAAFEILRPRIERAFSAWQSQAVKSPGSYGVLHEIHPTSYGQRSTEYLRKLLDECPASGTN